MTSNPIAAPVVQAALPEFVRIPKSGTVCPWTGLGRSYLYQLAKEGKIRTISMRKEGATRGIVLIHLASVCDFIRSFEKAAV